MTAGWMLVVALSVVSVAVGVPPAAPGFARRRSLPRFSRAVGAPAVGAGFGTAAVALLLVPGAVGLLLGCVVGLATWHGVRRLEPPAERRRREGLRSSLPLTVDLLAAVLTAGQAPTQAVDLVCEVVGEPMHSELSAVSARLRLGVDPTAVWTDLATGDSPLQPLGRTLVRAIRSGASVAEAMGRLADDLRREGRAVAETNARAVGVRASIPMGVCLLPAFVLIGVVPLVVGSVELALNK